MSGMGAAGDEKNGKKGKKNFGGNWAGGTIPGEGGFPAARPEGPSVGSESGRTTPREVIIPIPIKAPSPVSEAAKKTAQVLSRYKKLRARGRKSIMTTELEDFK